LAAGDRARAAGALEEGRAAAEAGRTIQGVGEAFGKLQEFHDFNDTQNQSADAVIKWHDELHNRMDRAQQSGNYEGFAKSLRSDLDADLAQRIENSPSPAAASALKSRFANLTDEISTGANHFEHAGRVQAGQAQRQTAIDDFAKLALRNDSVGESRYAEAMGNAAGAAHSGLLDPEQLRKEQQYIGNTIMGAAVQRRLETNPDRTLADLDAGRYDPYLDAQTLERLQPKMSSARVHSNINDIGRGAGGGASGDLADRIISAESGGRADAKNPLSSATGAGQFIDSTWLDQVKKNAPEIAADKSDAEILALRGDRNLSHRMVNSYAEENRQALASQGLPTDDGALYLAHYLGAGGAAKVLGADPTTPMASLVSADVLSANPSLKHMTAGDLRQMTAAKAGAGGGAGSAPPPIDSQIAETQRRVDAGKITPEEGDRVIGALTRRFHEWNQATAQDRAQLVDDTTNGIAMLQSGRDWHEDRAAILRLLPPEKAAETLGQIDEAREFGNAKTRVQWATPAELHDQGTEIKGRLDNPQDFARNKRYADQWDKVVKERAAALDPQKGDPAAYVAEAPAVAAARLAAANPADPHNPTPEFEAAIQASLTEQERLGVPEQDRRALTKPQAAARVQQILGADPAKTDMGAELDGTARAYGRYWPKAFGDLVKGGLPVEAQILAAMDMPEQAAARTDFQRMLAVIADKGGPKQLEEAAGSAHTLIDRGLDDRMADFRATVGDLRLYAAIKNGVKNLAYYYAFKGNADPLGAAYDGIIARKFDFGGSYRVPKGTLATVERAGDAILAQLQPEDLLDIGAPEGSLGALVTPEQRRATIFGAIQRGKWVNNRDDSGLNRVWTSRGGGLMPALRADGSQIAFTFRDAEKLAPIQGSQPTPEEILRGSVQ
jgi:hypothetical protein